AQDCITHRVDDYVTIGMAEQPFIMLDGYTSEDQGPAFNQSMNVKAYSNPVRHLRIASAIMISSLKVIFTLSGSPSTILTIFPAASKRALSSVNRSGPS